MNELANVGMILWTIIMLHFPVLIFLHSFLSFCSFGKIAESSSLQKQKMYDFKVTEIPADL